MRSVCGIMAKMEYTNYVHVLEYKDFGRKYGHRNGGARLTLHSSFGPTFGPHIAVECS